jgi:phosphate transport system substrate-binding protein
MKKLAIIVLATLTLLGGLLLGAKMIQIKGSDTMVNLAQILAEEYMGKNPGTPIAVLGGGSGTGITGLINQTCDIANHSREWKPKEIDQAWEKGVTPRPFVVSVDGLSIVVNEKNPIDQLTMAQVGALYRGEIKSWKVLGDFPKPVSLYGRQSNSGTYVFMQEFVLGNKNYSPDMKEMNGNAQIIEGLLQDEGAVGYVGVGYLFDENHKIRRGLKVLRISKEPNGPGYMPTDKAAVESGAYPISRPLYMATNGKPKGDVAKFLAWVVGPEGQAIVEREGFFTIGEGKYKAGNDKNFK